MRCVALVLASWLGVGLAAVSSSGPVGDERGTSDGALKEKVAWAIGGPDGLFSARWRLRRHCERELTVNRYTIPALDCKARKVYTFTLEDPSELPRLAEILRDQGELVLDRYEDVRANVEAVENFRRKIEVVVSGTIALVGLGGEPLGTGTPNMRISFSSTDTWEDVELRVAKKLGFPPGTLLSLVPTNSGDGLHEGQPQPLRGPVKHSGVEHIKQVTVLRHERHRSQQLEQAAHHQHEPEAAEKLLGTMLRDKLGWKRVHVTLGQYSSDRLSDKRNRWFLDVEEYRPLWFRFTQCRHSLGSILGCDQRPSGVVSLLLGKHPNGRDDIPGYPWNPERPHDLNNWKKRFAPEEAY